MFVLMTLAYILCPHPDITRGVFQTNSSSPRRFGLGCLSALKILQYKKNMMNDVLFKNCKMKFLIFILFLISKDNDKTLRIKFSDFFPMWLK